MKNGEEITGSFYEKELQKTSQEKFRTEKVLKRTNEKLHVKWKGYDNCFNSWIDKKDFEWNFLNEVFHFLNAIFYMKFLNKSFKWNFLNGIFWMKFWNFFKWNFTNEFFLNEIL